MVGLKAVYYTIDKRVGEQEPCFTRIITVRIAREQESGFFSFSLSPAFVYI